MKFEVIGNHRVAGKEKGEIIEIDNEVLAQTLLMLLKELPTHHMLI